MEKIQEIYDAAVKKKPKNDELLSHLFMAYVRTEDYEKQQHTALALHKVVPSNPYYSWAVMSIVMQVLLILYMWLDLLQGVCYECVINFAILIRSTLICEYADKLKLPLT